jgi:ribonuclease G
LIPHDLFAKPAATFADHALGEGAQLAAEILIHVGLAELTVAKTVDGRLERLWRELTLLQQDAGQVGDVVLGRVRRLLPAADAAFVDIGQGRAGFLSLRDAQPLTGERKQRIGDVVREGEALLVQIIKDAVGDKGARLTSNVTLPGRFLVLTPGGAKLAISHRIADDAERARLTNLMKAVMPGDAEGIGYVVRTAAGDASADELRADAEYLTSIWRRILAQGKIRQPPAVLHREAGLITRVLRDEAGNGVDRILVDDREALAVARAAAPDAKSELFSGGDLFEHAGIADELETLDLPKVTLPSGGWLMIEATEALTAIDVNSGAHTASGAFEDTALAVNLEAAAAAARQIVLRGIGGLIIVDFLRMRRSEDEARILALLTRELAKGHVPSEAGFSPLGFAAITRRRDRRALDAATEEPCGACGGTGRRKSLVALARDVLRGVEKAAAAAPGKQLTVHAAPELADFLETRRAQLQQGLARRGAATLNLVADPLVPRERFSVETTG